MSHSEHSLASKIGGLSKSHRTMLLASILGCTVIIAISWLAINQFWLNPSQEQSSKEHGPIGFWDHLYGVLLLLHLHPIESIGDGHKFGHLSFVRVLFPIVWDILIVAAIAAVLVYRKQLWQWIKLRISPPEIVIIGWSPVAKALAQSGKANRRRVLILAESMDERALSFCAIHSISIIEENFSRSSNLDRNQRLAGRLRMSAAQQIIFADSEDGRNIENAELYSEIVKARTKNNGSAKSWSGVRLVHVSDTILLRNLEITGLLERSSSVVFNWDELRSRDAVNRMAPLKDILCKPDEFVPAHLAILGDSSLATFAVKEFVSVAQWSPTQRPKVTLVSKEAESHKAILLGLYPALEQCSDLETITASTTTPTIRSFITSLNQDQKYRPIIFIAEADHHKAASEALWISRQPLQDRIQVLVPSNLESGALRLIHCLKEELNESKKQIELLSKIPENHPQHADHKKKRAQYRELQETFQFSDKIRLFGHPESLGLLVLDETFFDKELNRHREGAEVFHDVYSKKPDSWNTLHPAFRLSNREAYHHIYHKLTAVGIEPSQKNVDELSQLLSASGYLEGLAKLEHLRWNTERLLAGWTHGTEKSVKDRISPCLVSWEELEPLSAKDHCDYQQYDRDSVMAILELERKMRGDVPNQIAIIPSAKNSSLKSTVY
jgi:hypothetical protein